MNQKNRPALADRVARAARAVLVAKSYASKIDVLVEISRLDAGTVERWRRGQIHCLEGVIQTNPWRILEATRRCSAESAREQRHDWKVGAAARHSQSVARRAISKRIASPAHPPGWASLTSFLPGQSVIVRLILEGIE